MTSISATGTITKILLREKKTQNQVKNLSALNFSGDHNIIKNTPVNNVNSTNT